MTLLTHPALQLFSRLAAIPAPSGREAKLAQEVEKIISEIGFVAECDPAGNVLVRLSGKTRNNLTILAAHMDEIGLGVKAIEADGTLLVEPIGGLHPWKLGERPVTILGSNREVTGIVSAGAGHGMDTTKPITWENFKVITGMTPEELDAAGVRPGTPMVPLVSERGPILLGDGDDPLVAAWTFDDRMGVVALLRLLEQIKLRGIVPNVDLIVAFTVQEEVGGLGIKTLAAREKPLAIVAVDGSPMPKHAGLKLDGRPGAWARDRLAIYDPEMLELLKSCTEKAGTSLQVAAHNSAASDASMCATLGLVSRIADVGHIRENSHGYEVSRLSVFDNVLAVLVEFVQAWKG